MTARLVITVTLSLVAAVVLPVAWILSRELLRRFATRRATRLLERALPDLDRLRAEASVEAAAAALERRYDAATLERMFEAVLRDPPGEQRTWLAGVADRLGMTARYAKQLGEARGWSERTHAAEMLGHIGAPGAVPALASALRDPYEDAGTVKLAAAKALARIRDPQAVPTLCQELRIADDRAAPRVAEALLAFGEVAVPALVETLDTEESHAALVWACRILGRIGQARAAPALIERLHHWQDAVRIAAAEALGLIADRRAKQPLVRAALRDPVPQVRAHAAAAIGQIGDPDALDVLVAALADPDYGTRMLALEALETIQPADLSPIERALRDDNPEVRRRAALALERLGYLEARLLELGSDERATEKRAYRTLLELGRAGLVDSLAGHLHHADFQVRAHVAHLLGELGAARAGGALLAASDDPAWPVRARAAEAIGRLRPEGGAAALVALFEDRELPVREAAAEALAAFPAAELAPLHPRLLAGYQCDSALVRAHVVGLVAPVDRPETTALLVRASADPSEGVRLRALAALSGRAGQLSLEPFIARLADSSSEVRKAAVDALGRVASGEVVPVLLQALPGATPEVRDRIAEALARRGFDEVRAQVAELTGSPDVNVRLGITWTLGKLGNPAGIAVLARLLRDPDARLRASAAGALGKIRASEAVAPLVAAADDRDERTRAAVVNALAKQGGGDPRVVDALAARLIDPDAFVRNRAAIALGRAGGPAAEPALIGARARQLAGAPAVALGFVLLGSQEGMREALDLLANPALLAEVRAQLAREDEWTRRTFFERLRLEDVGGDLDQALAQPAVIAQYQQILRSSHDLGQRRLAVDVLARVLSERSIPTLADAVATDPADGVRQQAAQALAALARHDPAREALARAVHDPSPEVAMVAVRALGHLGDLRFADPLFARLGAGGKQVDLLVEEALAEIYRASPVALVDRLLGNDSPGTVVTCIRILARLGDPGFQPLLREFMKSRAAPVRVAAVQALAALPSPTAAAAVDEALGDPDESVRLAALEAIAPMAGAAARLRAASRDPALPLRRRLAELAGGLSAASAESLLEPLLEDLAPPVRAAALLGLLGFPDEQLLGRFHELWQRDTDEVRAGVRGDPRAAGRSEALGESLRSEPSATLRRLAVVCISDLALDGHEALLLRALSDPSPAVRLAVVKSLAQSRDEGVKRRVLELINDPDDDVREIARKSRLRAV